MPKSPRMTLDNQCLHQAENSSTSHLNVDRFLKVWAEILSDHYGVYIKFTAIKKEEEVA